MNEKNKQMFVKREERKEVREKRFKKWIKK